MTDPYLTASGVLRNKQGLTDPAELQAYERRMALVRVGQLDLAPLPGRFDFEHLRAIHRHILQDVYDWAGDLRVSDTAAMGLPHCRPAFLPDQCAFVFRRLARDLPLPQDKDKALDAVAKHWGELTALHPFRDGNSRSQRVFFDAMLREAGWQVDWRQVDAARVHAARHVAMAVGDSSHLARALSAGMGRWGERAAGSLTATEGLRSERAAGELFHQMMAERSRGRAAGREGPGRGGGIGM